MAKTAKAAFIPQQPEELTTEWLTAALSQEALSQGATVTGFTTGRPGTGVGFSGITVKLTMEWDRDDPTLPREVVAKFPTDMAHRGLTEAEGGYEREIWFYEGLGADMPLRIPTCHYSEMDPGPGAASRRRKNRIVNRTPKPIARFIAKRANDLIRATDRRYVLLIEYVPDARLTTLDQEVPADDLQAIMHAIAKMHARYWREPRLAADLATSYDTASQNYKFLQAGYDLWADDFFARTDGLEERHRVVTDWAHVNLEAVLERLNVPFTLLHGDVRAENMLFLPSGELVMIDFGTVSSGPPAWDVAYALSASLEPGPDARATMTAMATAYHDALLAAGVTEYSLDELLNDIDVALCFLAHRQVLTAMVMDGGYDTDDGASTGLGDLWIRKIIDLLPPNPPQLEN
jgi:thiamine kinase-like enzyme